MQSPPRNLGVARGGMIRLRISLQICPQYLRFYRTANSLYKLEKPTIMGLEKIYDYIEYAIIRNCTFIADLSVGNRFFCQPIPSILIISQNPTITSAKVQTYKIFWLPAKNVRTGYGLAEQIYHRIRFLVGFDTLNISVLE